MKKRSHTEAGFTLVEIIIVFVIIVLLSALAYPALNKVREKYKEREIVENLEDIVAVGLQYLEEKEVQSVDVPTLTASGYLEPLTSVAGEEYSALKVVEEGGFIFVLDEDGDKVKLEY